MLLRYTRPYDRLPICGRVPASRADSENNVLFDSPTFTLVHVAISLLGVISGLVVLGGLIAGLGLNGWTALFLASTILTSVTGFAFPATTITPAHVVGALSLIALAACLAALYWKRLVGPWRATYVVTAALAVYLNVFVLVVQTFAKTPALAQLAPTQQEPPFAVTQAAVLGLFVWLGWTALRRFRQPATG
jgi:hypothetical protein